MRGIKIIMLVYFLALIFLLTCEKKDSPTEPPTISLPDTGSHEFIWQIDVLGDGNASDLRDICIVDDNNVWAVGEIYVKDSLGQFSEPAYNAVHWNGKEWYLVRVPVRDYGSHNTWPYPLRTVFGFGPNDVWFNAGAALIHWDGKKWYQRAFFLTTINDSTYGPVNKMWGACNSNLYCVGNKGMIVHYKGTTWQKLESGTSQHIYDIWGSISNKNEEIKIFCTAADKYHGGEKKILQITKDHDVMEFDWPPQSSVHSVWFGKETPIYVCGSGLFIYEKDQWSEVTELPKIYKNRVRGNHQNDIFVVGDFGFCAHYNGKSWRVYDSLRLPNGNYEGLAVKDDLVVAVGWNGDKAVVLQGKRKKFKN